MTVLPLARDGRKPRRPSRAPLLPRLGGGHEGAEAAADGGFDGASFTGAVFNLSTTVVGAGIMALPAAVKVLGLVPGLAMIVLGAFLTEASIDMILRAGRPPSGPRATSYAAVVGDAFGSTCRALLQTCVVVNNLGMLVVYMIIIGIHPHPSPSPFHFSRRKKKKQITEHSPAMAHPASGVPALDAALPSSCLV